MKHLKKKLIRNDVFLLLFDSILILVKKKLCCNLLFVIT